MDSASTFGQWLKQRRRELDLTQEAVAEGTGYSPDTIRKIEAGNRRPSRQIAEILADFLRVDPGERETFVLWARGIVSGASPPATGEPPTTAAATTPQPATAPGTAPTLPILPTPLIGREQDLAHMKNLLWRSTTRLLTLLGPPGVGKTSLSNALASALQADFKDGLLYVPLGPIADPALVAPTIAERLGVSEAPGRPVLESLQIALRDKQMLLILDNFEQVVRAAPLLTDLLAVAHQLKVLVTSRSPLHVRGEKLVEVPPLEVPDPEHLPPLEELAHIGSVALFVERGRDVKDNFELTPDNAPIVAAICARLEGLPLAIELAAARTRLLSLSTLLARLEQPFNVLTGGPRDAPVQQRALLDSLESSYRLLSANEQQLFRRLGIFAGPFTLDAAEKVAEATLEDLEAVLDQSLLHLYERSHAPEVTSRSPDTEPHFGMLIPVREYALRQLETAGETYQIALNHARYFLGIALTGNQEMRGPTQKLWLDRIEAVYGDIRTTLDWTLKNNQTEIALRLVGVMRKFWLNRGYRQEGVRWTEQALSQGKNAAPDARIEALIAAGVISNRQGLRTEAEHYLSEAISLSRELGDRPLLANAFLSLGGVFLLMGDYDRALECALECEPVFRELDDQLDVAKSLAIRASVLSRRQDHDQALILYEEALAIRRKLGAPFEISVILQNLGMVALRKGEYRRAIAYADECAAMNAEVGSKEIVTFSNGLAGKAAYELGEYVIAASRFGRCLTEFVEMGTTAMIAYTFEEIARIDVKQGNPAKATRLFAVADALRQSAGITIDEPNRVEIANDISTLKEALSEPEFNAAWTVGHAMPLADAVAYAKDRPGISS